MECRNTKKNKLKVPRQYQSRNGCLIKHVSMFSTFSHSLLFHADPIPSIKPGILRKRQR